MELKGRRRIDSPSVFAVFECGVQTYRELVLQHSEGEALTLVAGAMPVGRNRIIGPWMPSRGLMFWLG